MHAARRLILQTTSIALAASIARLAFAQSPFPSRPIRLLVGFPPGGTTDIAARALAQRMSKTLGQPVLVDNRPGGQTIIATGAGARAEPDGYTLTFAGIASLILNPLLYNNLPYKPSDFKLLGSMARQPMLLIVRNDLGVNDVQEFVAMAKNRPGEISCGHAGNGSINHMALLQLQSKTETNFLGVPYKGSALVDVLAGTVHSTFDFAVTALGGLQVGKYKALAVTGDRRLSVLPNVPTMQEAGVQDCMLHTRQIVATPANIPPAVAATLENAIRLGVQDPSLVQQFAAQGTMVEFIAAPDLEKVVANEFAFWQKVIQSSNIPKTDLRA